MHPLDWPIQFTNQIGSTSCVVCYQHLELIKYSHVPVKMMFLVFPQQIQHNIPKLNQLSRNGRLCAILITRRFFTSPTALKMKHLTCHSPYHPHPPTCHLKWEGIPCAGFRIADRQSTLHWQRRCEMGQTIGWCPQRSLSSDRAKFWLKEPALKIYLLRNTVWLERNYLSLSFLLLYTVLNQQQKPKITIRWIQPGTEIYSSSFMGATCKQVHTSPAFTIYSKGCFTACVIHLHWFMDTLPKEAYYPITVAHSTSISPLQWQRVRESELPV